MIQIRETQIFNKNDLWVYGILSFPCLQGKNPYSDQRNLDF